MSDIPNEAIEAAIRALFDLGLSTADSGFYGAAALTAALPHIEAAVRADERERIVRELRAAATAIYPPDIFPLLGHGDWAAIRAAVESAGYPLDRVSGNLMRRGIQVGATEVETTDE